MAALLRVLINRTPLPRPRDLHLFVLFFLLLSCESLESHEEKPENYLLCKYCGADAADLDYAFAIKSPLALKIENQTFSGKEVVVQTLKNPHNTYFEVITVKKSNCIGHGEWSKQDTWFPGFAWKLCICQPWGHFLGWLFEPLDQIKFNQKKASERGFYALNAESILTEQFSNSLLITSKSFISEKLTEEQQKFLSSLEEEFKDRYTEKDEEFMAVLTETLPLPPIMENWRDFRQQEDRRGSDRDRHGYDQHGYDRRRDRYSHSSGYVHRHNRNNYNSHRPY